MRKLSLAVLGAAFVLAAIAGPTMASSGPVGALDQSNTTFTAGFNNNGGAAQTIVAGKTGLISNVKLYVKGGGGWIFVGLCDKDIQYCSTFSQGVTPGPNWAWVDFAYDYPQPIVKGNAYSLVFYTSNLGAAGAVGYSATDTYGHGKAMAKTGTDPWAQPQGVGDFDFQLFTTEQIATAAWDKPSLERGKTTPLTLTETFAFPAYNGAMPLLSGRPNAGNLASYSIKAGTLPAWFTPSGVTCSSHVAVKDCTLANATGTGILPVQASGTVTITIAGSAAPPLSGGARTAQVQGCATYGTFVPLCVTGTAQVTLTAASATPTPIPTATPTPTPAVTLPPTSGLSTDAHSNSGAFPALALLIFALAAAGSVLTLAIRRTRD